MVGGGGRFLDFLRFNLVVPSVVLVVLGFCEDDIFLRLCLSLSLSRANEKKNTDRQRQSFEEQKSLAKKRSFLSLSLCVCVCLCGFFQPARACVLIYEMLNFRRDRSRCWCSLLQRPFFLKKILRDIFCCHFGCPTHKEEEEVEKKKKQKRRERDKRDKRFF